MNNHSVKGKVVVITGASAGLGRSIAQVFGREQSKICLIARGKAGLEAAKAEIEALGGEALIYQADVADADAMEAAAELTEKVFGPIDIWINNAMTSVFSPVLKMTAAEYKRVTEVTYLGQVYGALAALKRMSKRNKGKIVFVGSALAYRGIPLQSAYCAAKHAIQGFCDSLRTELMHSGSNVKMTMVQLPAMNTPQFGWVRNKLPHKARPMGKIFSPDYIAESILFAATHDRREILIGIPTVEAVEGNKIAPWLGDMVLAETGVEGQQLEEAKNTHRKDNLYHPMDEDKDWGAHGNFSDLAHHSSLQVWVTTHRAKATVAALLAGIAVFAGVRAITSNSRT